MKLIRYPFIETELINSCKLLLNLGKLIVIIIIVIITFIFNRNIKQEIDKFRSRNGIKD